MDNLATVIITTAGSLLVALMGKDGIVTIIQAIKSWRAGVDEDELSAVKEDASPSNDPYDLKPGLREEIDRLREDRAEDAKLLTQMKREWRAERDRHTERMDAQDRRIENLAAESRRYETAVIGIIERLRRGDDYHSILDYIKHVLPSLGGPS